MRNSSSRVLLAGRICCRRCNRRMQRLNHSRTRANDQNDSFDLLFNGRDFSGWEQTKGWTIDNGAIYCDKQPEDIFGVIKHTAKPLPKNFELVFEWKVKRTSPSPFHWSGYFLVSDGLISTDTTNPKQIVNKFRSKLKYRTSGNFIILETAPVNVGSKTRRQWREHLSLACGGNRAAGRRVERKQDCQ